MNFLRKLLSNSFAVLDIGASKISVAVAKRSFEDRFKILGSATVKSRGIERGLVINIEEFYKALKEVVKLAEEDANEKIEEISLNISGEHLESVSADVSRAVDGIVTNEDRDALIESYNPSFSDRWVVHRVAYDYAVDGHRVESPVGMMAKTISAKLNVVTGRMGAIDAIVRTVRALNIEPIDMLTTSYASAISTMSYSDKRSGAISIDIGAQTTDIAVVKQGQLIYSDSIGVGGDFWTFDIATVLNLDFSTAEYLKNNYDQLIKGGEYYSLDAKGESKISLSYVKSIIDARTDELIDLIMKDKLIPMLPRELVLTGGASYTPSLREKLSINIASARLGYPLTESEIGDVLRSPEHSTLIGLLERASIIHAMENEKTMTLSHLFDKIKSIFKNKFLNLKEKYE